MATRKSAQTGQNNEDSTKPGPQLRSRKKSSSSTEESESDEEQANTGMSLDVLAQVASETLQKEPNPQRKASPKKISLRSVQSLEVLNLDQIQALTERTMLNFFSEVTSNEMTRNFTYTCHLMPKQCQKRFTSFGSEMRARIDMRKHLYQHVEELVLEAKDPSQKSKFKFTAEPIHVRKKKIYNAFLPPKKKKKIGRPSTTHANGTIDLRVYDQSVSYTVKKRNNRPISALELYNITESIDACARQNDVSKASKARQSLQTGAARKRDGVPDTHSEDSGSDKGEDSSDETDKRIEENEQFIIDLLSRTQPHHDHCYTTIFGKRKGIEEMFLEDTCNLDGEESNGDKEIDVVEDVVNPSSIAAAKIRERKAHPILFLRHRSPDENVPMVSMEEIINDSESEEEISPVHTGQKPYPPMPKSNLARRGRLAIPEEYPTNSSEEEDVGVKRKKRTLHPLSREGREGNLDWEPKLAMRYIRELKGKRKDEIIPLKCKICKDKTFTATATLMYHYRSHAGIKPFVCLICNTTFTRQHSLNYHMLIHNNQSRFTCKDCGRKFRHPSHFKEHLRRHTGETPFQCMDCGQRFKTRNTYKRHLKTRHGKLLTASGIHQLSKEEFLKVRTKPYRIRLLPEISYEMPELTFTKLKSQRSAKGTKDAESFLEIDIESIKQEKDSDSEMDAVHDDKTWPGSSEALADSKHNLGADGNFFLPVGIGVQT